MTYSRNHLNEARIILENLSEDAVEAMAYGLAEVKKNFGRIFFLGVGGSAANCSHAVNDFRKLANIESYAPTDNVAEITARTNDEGWETVFEEWLKVSQLRKNDCIFVMSVGGGNLQKKVSVNLCRALDYAKSVGAVIFGIVGRDGGYTKQVANCCVVIPTISESNVTPHSESMQAVIWHLLVSHPLLKENPTKW